MTVRVRQSATVQVNVTERSVTYITNTMFRMFLRIARACGLTPDYITSNREIIENGLFAWLAEATLLQAHLEVYFPGQGDALERWDFAFSYASTPGAGTHEPPVAEAERFCAALEALPPGASFRVVIQTAPGATEVPGWVPAQLRRLDETGNQAFEAWGLDGLSAAVTYRAGTR